MPRKYNNGNWTQARFNSFVKSALRSASIRWPPKYEALNESFIGVKTNIKTGRQAKHFKCNSCGGHFPAKEVQVDHVEPVINPLTGFVSWDDVIDRMFCEKPKFQVLCTSCHKIKTDEEKLIRKLNAK